MKDKIFGWLRVLTTPRCWIQLHPYAKEWDEFICDAMRRGAFGVRGKHTGKYVMCVDDHLVWVANHPYASFTSCSLPREVRPRRITILRAMDELQRRALSKSDE